MRITNIKPDKLEPRKWTALTDLDFNFVLTKSKTKKHKLT